ncbi:MAG: enoyl-ACP reductase FabV [Candidatus Omnitrophota bacterium]
MIIQPKIRGFICTTAHPQGCARHVQEQIDYVKKNLPIKNGPKKVLVVGASTGFGLASRIVAAFGCQAASVGVFYERPAENKRTATAGWYNSIAFDKFSKAQGLYSKSINGDAFSDEIKQQAVDAIKKNLGTVDLVIYSLASPRRTHPKTGLTAKSALKPVGPRYTNKSIDFETGEIIDVSLESATEDEVRQTVSVMGGEDWEMWIDALDAGGVLANGAMSVAYSYIGPDVTRPVYRNGTIGAAKDHLEATAKKLDERLKKNNGRAFISVNKALVTQSSSAIPFIPLYFILLNRIMKEKNIHEGCIEQMYRLFSQRLYNGTSVPVDDQGRIRVDDLEMRDDVQAEVAKLWSVVSTGNVEKISDIEGYRQDFLKLFGFGFKDVDYSADVDADPQFE